jgi:NAD(P)-dependent dehydrogenase (short-subunit alcohol dehydrogenase family)
MTSMLGRLQGLDNPGAIPTYCEARVATTKQIVITGVTRGLGRAMADGFIAAGHQVTGCGRDTDAIQSLANLYPTHRFSVVDVASEQQVREWAETTLSDCGAPDLLINNAATINANAPLWKVSESEFARVTDININAVQRTIRVFCPAMIQRGRGVICNFSSGWGRSVAAEVAPYCATKWAIEGMTKALAQELPAGLAAVALNPGIIHTDLLDSCFGEQAASFDAPETWAATAVPYLLSLNASHNGQSLTAP